jgi:hypothetical protein
MPLRHPAFRLVAPRFVAEHAPPSHLPMPKKSSRQLRIVLGDKKSWSRFVPQPPEGSQMLGTIYRGLSVGGLAELPQGGYAQVNGDVVQPLNASQVRAALGKARAAAPRVPRVAANPAAAVKVTVIRRRTLMREPVEDSARDGADV